MEVLLQRFLAFCIARLHRVWLRLQPHRWKLAVTLGLLGCVLFAVIPITPHWLPPAAAGLLVLFTWRPLLGLAAFVLLLPFETYVTAPLLGTFTSHELLIMLTFLGWLLQRIYRNEPPRRAALLAGALPWLAVIACSVASYSGKMAGLKGAMRWSEPVLVFWLAGELSCERAFKRYLVFSGLCAGSFAALLGVAQPFLAHFGVLQFLVMSREGGEINIIFNKFVRAHATFIQANHFADYLLLVAAPLAYMLLRSGKREVGGRESVIKTGGEQPQLGVESRRGVRNHDRSATSESGRSSTEAVIVEPLQSGQCFKAAGSRRFGSWRSLLPVYAVVWALALVFTFSRGAWLAACSAVLLALLYTNHKRPAAALLGLALLISLAMAGRSSEPTGLLKRVASLTALSHDETAMSRLAMYRVGWELFRWNPFIGIGAGRYLGAVAGLSLIGLPRLAATTHLHSIYLQAAAEMGLAGLIAFLFWVGAPVLQALLRWRREMAGSDRAWIAALLFSVAAYLGHSLFDVFLYRGLHLLFGLWLGALAAAGESARSETE